MRNKYYKQHDVRDCAAACLATVLYFHKVELPLVEVREKLKINRNGASLEAITCVAQEYGFLADAYQSSVEELLIAIKKKEVELPIIAHVVLDNLQHYVVINGISNNKIKYFDPIGKIKNVSIEEFSQMWSGYFVNIKKTTRCQEIKLKRKNYFSNIIKKEYKKILFVVVLSIFMAIISIMEAFFYQNLIDIIAYKNSEVLFQIGFLKNLSIEKLFIYLLFLIFIQIMVEFFKNIMLINVEEKVEIKLSKQFLQNVMHLPFLYFKNWNTGEILSRYHDMGKIQELFSHTVFSIIYNLLVLFISGGFLVYLSRPFFGITMITAIIYLVIMLGFKKGIESYNRKVMQSNEKITKDMKEYIDGIDTVKSYSMEKMVYHDLLKSMKTLYNNIKKGKWLAVSEKMAMNIVNGISSIIIMWIGFVLISDEKMSLGTLIALETLAGYFVSPILELVNLQPGFQDALIAMERLEDIYGVEKEKLMEEKEKKNTLNGDIIFKNVSFRYGFEPYVLENINFSIPKGAKILISGKSGTGKTTVVNLLKGFFQAEKGDIYIGKENLNEVPISEIRNNIVYISQTPYFFTKTIYENIVLDHDSISEEVLSMIIEGCQLTEVIENMPLGINTIISENGKNLSGGQKQRLAIARALILQPKILIIDEGTNELDVITEKKVMEFINQYLKDCTVIIISHGTQNVMGNDMVIELDKLKKT